MNKKLIKQVDEMINNVNNITDPQLKSIDLYYLKAKRLGSFIIIMGLFDSVFLAKLREQTDLFNNLTYPNKIFKCFVVLGIDVSRSKYSAHRLYSFPNNLDLYNYSRKDIHKVYKDILKQLEKNPLKLNVDTKIIVSSNVFKCSRPVSNNNSHYFEIELSTNKDVYFDIDNFVDQYVTIEGNNLRIRDNFYNYPTLFKKDFLDNIKCVCQENRKKLRYVCNDCNNAIERDNCMGHHARKCNCGNWTYYRQDNCLRCHIIYSKAGYMKEVFYDNDQFNTNLISNYRTLSNYIPFFHYNQNSSGICLGNGSRVITDMIQREINPVKLMLSFKANLAFTDADNTRSYYRMYTQKLTESQFANNQEFHAQLANIFRNRKNVTKRHVFSIRCFCPQCFYYRVCLFQEDIKLDPRGFEDNQPYLVSRDQFIKTYHQYLQSHNSKSYLGSYIHKMIKQITNIQPKDFLIKAK